MNFPQNLTLNITNQESFGSRPLMDPESKRKWIEALRSREFKQGQKVLHDPGADTYCCLGVKAKIDGNKMIGEGRFQIDWMTYSATLPVGYEKGLSGGNGEFIGFSLVISEEESIHSLVGLNDNDYSFDTIAEVIDKLF